MFRAGSAPRPRQTKRGQQGEIPARDSNRNSSRILGEKEIAIGTATLTYRRVSNLAECFPGRRLNTMAETVKIEKFAANELTSLRDELTRSGIDLWQAGEVLSAFLAGRGYGVIPEQARDAVLRLEGPGCSHECIQSELERVALVM